MSRVRLRMDVATAGISFCSIRAAMHPRWSAARGLAAVAAATLFLCVPGLAGAQASSCSLYSVGGFSYSTRFGSADYTHYASGGVDYRCRDGSRTLADSAVVIEAIDQLQLFGNVRFNDPQTRLHANELLYFGNDSEIRAWGNVVVTDLISGAVIRGDTLIYYRASDFRPLEQMIVYGGSPHATVQPPAPAPPPPEGAEELPEDTTEPGNDSTEASAEGPPVPDTTELGNDSTEAGAEDPPVSDTTELGNDSTEAGAEDPPVSDTTELGNDSTEAGAEDTRLPDMTEPEEAEAADAVSSPAQPASTSPYEIDAEQFLIDGRRFFKARGDVLLTRDSLRALGDSLDYDQEVGTMAVTGNARVEDESFNLTARYISFAPDGLNEEIFAREEAVLIGGTVTVQAPGIRLHVNNGDLERLIALKEAGPLLASSDPGEATSGLTPGDLARLQDPERRDGQTAEESADTLPQPWFVSGTFDLHADSVDVVFRSEQIESLVAVGAARTEGLANGSQNQDVSALPEVARSDWMEGDTITGHFSDPVPDGGRPAPAPGRSRLDRLTAAGNATSLYRMAASDTTLSETETGTRPDDDVTVPVALHYVAGNRITIYLDQGEVTRMEVVGLKAGYHLEPLPPGSLPDSASAVPDTTTEAPDTTLARETLPVFSATLGATRLRSREKTAVRRAAAACCVGDAIVLVTRKRLRPW